MLIAACALFVAVEFGLVAADRGRIDREAAQGSARARLASSLLHRLSFHLSGAQLGITFVSLILGFVAEPAFARVLAPLLDLIGSPRARSAVSVVLALGIATAVQLVFGELVPKGLAIAAPERTSMMLSPFMRAFSWFFSPLIRVLNASANIIVRRFGIEPAEELVHVRTLPELALVFQASEKEGTIAGSASKLLHRSVRFGEKTADDAMVPRVEVQALPSDATVDELVVLARATGFSRLPIYGADLDDVQGVVHVKAVYDVPRDRWAVTPVAQLMAPVLAVPESRELAQVLRDLRVRRNQLVVVVDEYGGTAGILTIEDIVEEIVGEIADEYDLDEPVVRHGVADGVHVVSGGMHADEVEEAIGFRMPEGEYETLAGFVLDRLGHIPEVGEVVEHDGWSIEVAECDGRRIITLHLVAPAGGLAERGDGAADGLDEKHDVPGDPA